MKSQKNQPLQCALDFGRELAEPELPLHQQKQTERRKSKPIVSPAQNMTAEWKRMHKRENKSDKFKLPQLRPFLRKFSGARRRTPV